MSFTLIALNLHIKSASSGFRLLIIQSLTNENAKVNSFPDSIKVIGNQVLFNNKNITSFVVGNNVVSMGEGVFGGCKKYLGENNGVFTW